MRATKHTFVQIKTPQIRVEEKEVYVMKKQITGLNKDYWLYWIASSASMAASNILQYVLSLYVLDITGSATLFASMLSIIIFPRLLLTPIAGVLADRTRKIRIMSGTLLAEGLILFGYYIYGSRGEISLLLIYILVIALEIGEIFYNGASAAILPEIVPEDKIKDAVSFSQIDDGIVVVISPMAAAIIYTNMEIAGAVGVVALFNLIACALQWMMRPKYESTREIETEKKSVINSFIGDFKEGICYIRENKFLQTFVKVLPIIDAFFGATFSVSVMYLFRESYQLSNYAYGLYGSITASMSLIVPMIVVPIIKKVSAEKLFTYATMMIAVEILGIGVAAFCGVNGMIPIMASVVMITVLDCMTIATAIPMQMASSILRQTNVKKEMLGRVSSVIRMAAIAAAAAGEMLFGVLNDMTYVWLPIFVGAAGVGVGSLLYRKKLYKG